ncbi:hypothetical protein GPALN_014898 [Globodera pallida]|nr:hypothetical protein GPALN_014898 [Globodera pallida]
MELFFFRYAEYERLYNCTGLEINSIALERRQFVPESIAVCVLCAIYYLKARFGKGPGPRTSLWITGCSLYALYWALFMKPVVYNSSIYFAWFFYPFADYRTDDDQHEEVVYEHWLHRVHNIAVAFLTPLIYLIFAAKLFYDVQKNRRQFGALSSPKWVQCKFGVTVYQRHRIGHIGGVTVVRPIINLANGASPKLVK